MPESVWDVDDTWILLFLAEHRDQRHLALNSPGTSMCDTVMFSPELEEYDGGPRPD